MIDLISRQDVIKMIQKTEQMHPYKVPGNRESYGEYAEAWNDATCLIEAQMVFIPSVNIEDTERKRDDGFGMKKTDVIVLSVGMRTI